MSITVQHKIVGWWPLTPGLSHSNVATDGHNYLEIILDLRSLNFYQAAGLTVSSLPVLIETTAARQERWGERCNCNCKTLPSTALVCSENLNWDNSKLETSCAPHLSSAPDSPQLPTTIGRGPHSRWAPLSFCPSPGLRITKSQVS